MRVRPERILRPRTPPFAGKVLFQPSSITFYPWLNVFIREILILKIK